MDNKLKNFYIGIKGVVVKDKKALVLKRKSEEGRVYWDIPGGRINGNEQIFEALKRELLEEVPSIKNLKIGELLHAYRLSHDLSDGHGLLLLFFRVEAEMDSVAMSKEHFEYRWIGLDELEEIDNEPGVTMEIGYQEAVRKALS